MENHLEEFPCHKDVFSRFCASKCTKKILEPLKKQLNLDKKEQLDSDPTWDYVSVAAKCRCVDEHQTQIKSQIAEHLVDESDFNFVMMPLLNHFSDYFRQLGNFLNICTELPEKVMMDHKQAYQQSNLYDADFQILRKNALKKVFQYRERNANAAKQSHDDDMPLIKALIKRMMKTCNQKSRPWIAGHSGVQCQKGSYRITIRGVSQDLPTSQTTLIAISVSLLWTMQNIFGTS